MKAIKFLTGKTLLVLILILTTGAAVWAEPLTLEQCIQAALENNYIVRAARNSYSTSRGQVYNAWGDILPSVSVSASASRSWPGQFDINILQRRTDSYNGALNFSLPITSAGSETVRTTRLSVYLCPSATGGPAALVPRHVSQTRPGFVDADRSPRPVVPDPVRPIDRRGLPRSQCLPWQVADTVPWWRSAPPCSSRRGPTGRSSPGRSTAPTGSSRNAQ